MAGSRDKLPFSPAEIGDLAKTMGYFQKRYADLAELMSTAEIKSINAGNVKLLRRGLSHVEKAVNAAYGAYDKELIRKTTKDATATAADVAKGKRIGRKAAKHATEAKP